MTSKRCYNCRDPLKPNQAKFCSADCRRAFERPVNPEDYPIDYDQHDRNAAESERIANFFNER